MRKASCLLVLIYAFACVICSSAQQRLTTAESKAHVGEHATVCGSVAGVHQAIRGKGQPTFINLDKPYPNQIFTILIWGSELPKFGNPEQAYPHKQVCVTGTITVFKELPEIVAHDPTAIMVQ